MARQRIVYDHRQIMSDDVNTITANNILNNQIVLRDAIGLTTGVVNGLDIAAGSVSGLAFPITSGTVSDGDGNFYELLSDTVYTLPDVNAVFNIYAKHTSTDDEPISGYILADVDTRTETYGTVNTRTYDSVTITGTTSTLTTGYTLLGTVGVNSSVITGRVDGRQYVTVNNQTGYSIQNFIATNNHIFSFSNIGSGQIYDNSNLSDVAMFNALIDTNHSGTGFRSNASNNVGAKAFEQIAENNVGTKSTLLGTAKGLLELIHGSGGYSRDISSSGNVDKITLNDAGTLAEILIDSYTSDTELKTANLTNNSANLTYLRAKSTDGSKWNKIHHFSDYNVAQYFEQSGSAIGSYYNDINGNETTGIIFDRVKNPIIFNSAVSSFASLSDVPSGYAGLATFGTTGAHSLGFYNGSGWEVLSEQVTPIFLDGNFGGDVVSGFTAVADNGGNCQFTYTGSVLEHVKTVCFYYGGKDTYGVIGLDAQEFTVVNNGSNQYTFEGLTYDASASTGMVFVIKDLILSENKREYIINRTHSGTYGSSTSFDPSFNIYMPSSGNVQDGQQWVVRINNPSLFIANANNTSNPLSTNGTPKMSVTSVPVSGEDTVGATVFGLYGYTQINYYFSSLSGYFRSLEVIITYDATNDKYHVNIPSTTSFIQGT